jgi:uncharacterized protein YndB with AHSA1/START domain
MRWLVVAMLGLALATPAAAETALAPDNCSRAANGERTLCHTMILPASLSEVWALVATAEGWRTWAAPVASLDLRSGGLLETSYNPNARAGEAGNIRNRVLAFTPERLLVIQIADAPPGFPHADLARELTTALELEPVDATHTRVRVTMMGYRDAAGFDELYDFFDRGNAFTLMKLRERIERGPVDWGAQNISPTEQR